MKTKILSKKLIYKGKHPYSTNLYGMWVQKGKEKYWRTYAQTREGLGVIPLTADNKLLMIREYKVIFGEYFWQIPTGYLEDNLSVVQNAKRELEEETGYTTHKLKKLFYYHPSMGSMKQRCNIVLAENVIKVQRRKPDDLEQIGISKTFSIKDAVKMIEKGKIVHDFTIIGIYYLASKLKR